MLARRHRLGTALADAFLTGPWDGDGLRSGAFVVLGQRHRWARDLAAEVLAAYPVRPADRPNELAEFVRHSTTLDEVQRRSSRQRRPVPTPRHRFTEPTTMVRRRFPVTPVDNAGDLAELLGLTVPDLLWFADTKGLQRRASVPGLHHYRCRWIRTTAGGARLLEAPLPRLRTIQRRVLELVLRPIPVHAAAHGFVAGRSVRTGAEPHVGAVTVVSLDLESFFASIAGGRIYGILRSAGYPEPVAHLLTGLCTQATAVRVLSSMPKTSDGSAAFRLRRHLAAPHLPQGAPTSPQLATLPHFISTAGWPRTPPRSGRSIPATPMTSPSPGATSARPGSSPQSAGSSARRASRSTEVRPESGHAEPGNRSPGWL